MWAPRLVKCINSSIDLLYYKSTDSVGFFVSAQTLAVGRSVGRSDH